MNATLVVIDMSDPEVPSVQYGITMLSFSELVHSGSQVNLLRVF
jgi:hypothetical protein